VSARDVIREVAHARNLRPWQVTGKCRRKPFVAARREVAKRLRSMGYSLADIGHELGDRHHTSVMYLLGLTADSVPVPFDNPIGGLGTDE